MHKYSRIRFGAILVLMLLVGLAGLGASEDNGSSDSVSGASEADGHPGGSAALSAMSDTDNPDAWKIVEENGQAYLEDSTGTRIEFRSYDRIVLTSAGAVEILYMLGAEERIAAIGTSRSGIWPEDKTSQLPDVGSLARPSFEQIIAAEPDLVVANGMNSELAADLNNMGIATVIHSTDTIMEILNAVLILGELTGTSETAIPLVEERRTALEDIRASVADDPLNLKGAFVYSIDPMMAFREDSLPGEILNILGVTNIADGLTTERPILTPEYILAENPDFLLGAMSIDEETDILEADSVIRETRAGKEENVFIVPSQLILRPTPRVIEALTMMHERLAEYAVD